MINLKTYLETVIALLPVYSALACGILLLYSRLDCLTTGERRIKNVSLLYMTASFFIWVFVFFYGYTPEIFVYIGAFAILTFLLVPVLFFRVIRFLTRMECEERFSPLHYVAPVLVSGIVFVWSFFVSLDVQVDIIRGLGSIIPEGYEAYAHFYLSASLFRVIFNLIYNTFTIVVLYRYYREASLATEVERKPANWVIFLIGVSLILLVNAFVAYFIPHFQAYTSPWFLLSALLIMTQQIVLTWHIIRRKYLLYAITNPTVEAIAEQNGGGGFRFHEGEIDHKILETYFRRKKPYLKQNFKINELVEALDVNRTIISNFINQTYGVNFNRYLNRWRLNELKRLQQLPSNRNKKLYSLLKKAGFTDSKHYLRTIRAEEKTTNDFQNKPRP